MPKHTIEHCIEIPWESVKSHLRGGFSIGSKAKFSIHTRDKGATAIPDSAVILIKWEEIEEAIETREGP